MTFIKQKKFYYLLLIVLSCSVVNLIFKSDNLLLAIAYSNFITIFPNLVVIYAIFKYLDSYNRIKNIMIPRMGLKRFLKVQVISSEFFMLLYIAIQYTFNILCNGLVSAKYMSILYIFLGSNILMLAMIVLIINLSVFNINRIILLGISVIINLTYHYGFILKYLNIYNK